MPEGPSILILKEAVQALAVIGTEVCAVSGNARIEQERLLHQRLTDVKSWGKQFLLCFPQCTLRIHFLLWGSYLINARKEQAVRLRLNFPGAELNFYSCSVKILEGTPDTVYDWSADVLSDQWSPRRALRKLRERPEMLVCDALLDQHIFAGVGNIIKNEVLYRIRVHPLSQIGALPDAKLRQLVREARVYSFQFLEWKKAYVLRAHWLAHNQSVCLRCRLPFHREYLGKSNRRTFYCNNCQKLYISGVPTLFSP